MLSVRNCSPDKLHRCSWCPWLDDALTSSIADISGKRCKVKGIRIAFASNQHYTDADPSDPFANFLRLLFVDDYGLSRSSALGELQTDHGLQSFSHCRSFTQGTTLIPTRKGGHGDEKLVKRRKVGHCLLLGKAGTHRTAASRESLWRRWGCSSEEYHSRGLIAGEFDGTKSDDAWLSQTKACHRRFSRNELKLEGWSASTEREDRVGRVAGRDEATSLLRKVTFRELQASTGVCERTQAARLVAHGSPLRLGHKARLSL